MGRRIVGKDGRQEKEGEEVEVVEKGGEMVADKVGS